MAKFGKVLKNIGKVAGVVAAPFTGGASLAITAGLMQSDAQKKANAAQDQAMRDQEAIAAEQERIRIDEQNKQLVNELKQLTLNRLGGDVSTPEWVEFLNYSVDNPANVTAVKAKAEDVVDKWQKRTGNRSTFSSDDPKLKYTSLQLENIENKQQANEITKQLQSVKDSLLGFITTPTPPKNEAAAAAAQKKKIIIFTVLGAGLIFLLTKNKKKLLK